MYVACQHNATPFSRKEGRFGQYEYAAVRNKYTSCGWHRTVTTKQPYQKLFRLTHLKMEDRILRKLRVVINRIEAFSKQYKR